MHGHNYDADGNAYLELEMTDDMPQKNMANMGIPMSTTAPPPWLKRAWKMSQKIWPA